MSETPQPEKPTPVAQPPATATAEKPAAPVEPPFSADDLQSSTARFTHKAWYLYYNNRKDMKFIREAELRATLEARSIDGAEELQKLLIEAGASSLSRSDKLLSFSGTYEIIQTIIRHPETLMVDTVKI
ncbi:hypothetical protein [Vampirovibrio sp.]|uniref:hypothetical protein n=1 Tax=Vampirovibrio sp. TaxID=2717857 RepID=UPI003594260E